MLDQLLQGRVGGDQVQRIGIQHQRRSALQSRAQQVVRVKRLAEPGPDGETIQMVELQNFVRRTQHQFGLNKVVSRSFAGEQAEVDASRAEMQGGASGEHRRACHTGRAADDAHATVIAFVAVGAAGRQDGLNDLAADHRAACGWRHRRIEIERAQMNLATVVRSFQRQQAGFQSDESRRMVGVDCAAAHAAGVGVEPARHVKRQHRRIELVYCLDE